MHYKIANGIVVKTENAAKPESQASSYLLSLLKKLPHTAETVDYGCGKLRYLKSILTSTDTLTLVDSEIQLSRTQILPGKVTSIRNLVDGSNRLDACNDVEFRQLNRRFDRGFCLNVLSAIPIMSERQRVIETIRSKLRRDGACLFVVQYRNSDFTRMKSMHNARPWRDGFLINSLRGYSFYGLISPEKMASMVKRGGFSITDVFLNEGSAYLWAAPR